MNLDHYTDDYIRVCKDNQIEPFFLSPYIYIIEIEIKMVVTIIVRLKLVMFVAY